MKKHKNFLGRLFRRSQAAACDDQPAADNSDQSDRQQPDETGTAAEGAQFAGPTLCKRGKLYRARLRNGRWETIGPPIGDC